MARRRSASLILDLRGRRFHVSSRAIFVFILRSCAQIDHPKHDARLDTPNLSRSTWGSAGQYHCSRAAT